MANSTASLESLPVELLHSIASFLHTPHFAALCKSSHLLYDAFISSLYREIVFGYGDGAKHHGIWTLLRTCLEKPHFASLIESLSFRGPEPRWSETHARRRALWSDVAEGHAGMWAENNPRFMPVDRKRALALAKQALQGSFAVIVGKTSERNGIELGMDSTGIALILICCRHVKTLGISAEYFNSPVLHCFIRHSAASGQFLQDLRIIDTHYDLQGRNDVLENLQTENMLQTLISLPKIEVVSTFAPNHSDNWTGSVATLDKNRIQTTHITLLNLHHTQLYEDDLGPILQACPKLKSLGYHPFHDLGQVPKPGRRDREFLNLSKLGDVLANAAQTVQLEHLALSYQLTFAQLPMTLFPLGVFGTLTTLSKLDHLKDLAIPWRFLMGSAPVRHTPSLESVLPDSLLSLTIVDDFFSPPGTGDWDDQAMLATLKSYLRRLGRPRDEPVYKSLLLVVFRKEGSWDLPVQEELKTHALGMQLDCCDVERRRPPMKWVGCASGQLLQAFP